MKVQKSKNEDNLTIFLPPFWFYFVTFFADSIVQFFSTKLIIIQLIFRISTENADVWIEMVADFLMKYRNAGQTMKQARYQIYVSWSKAMYAQVGNQCIQTGQVCVISLSFQNRSPQNCISFHFDLAKKSDIQNKNLTSNRKNFVSKNHLYKYLI